MKQVHIHTKPTRWQQTKEFLLENFFTFHKIALMVALAIALLLSFFFSWYLSLTPVYLHLALWAYGYYKHTIKKKLAEKVWDRYVEKYGDGKGTIPRQTRIHHQRMIRQGKQIEL